MTDREFKIQQAIANYNASVFPSKRAAAKAYSVLRSTMSDRENGRNPPAIAHAQEQRLTPDQEKRLVD